MTIMQNNKCLIKMAESLEKQLFFSSLLTTYIEGFLDIAIASFLTIRQG